MNIFLSFLQSEKIHPIPSYSFWEYYIKNGIKDAGHEYAVCPDVDWAFGLVPKSKPEQAKWRSEAWSKTVDWLKKHPADLFLGYLYPDQIDVTAIRQIQQMGIPCVNFFCDNVRDFRNVPVEFGVFDLNWVPEYKAVKLYQKAGYGYINLPMPMWIAPKLRTVLQESYRQITFIGSKDIQRKLFFEKVVLKDGELPIAIYGKGWDKAVSEEPLSIRSDYTFYKKLLHQYSFIKQNGAIAYSRKISNRKFDAAVSAGLRSKIHGLPEFEQYNELTAQSTITVGVNRYPSFHFPILKPDTYSRLRDIEAPMLGACYLTEYTEGIEDLYDIDQEIETYKSPEEFTEKARRLLGDDAKRWALKINGQKRALQDHTIGISLKKIQNALKLSN